MKLSSEVLTAALEGLEAQRARIDGQIAEVRRALGAGPRRLAARSGAMDDWETPMAAAVRRKRPKLSAAARKRISDAQKKRWAKIHAGKTGKEK